MGTEAGIDMKRRNLDPAKRHLQRLKTKHQKCRKENAWLKEEIRKKEKTYDEAKWLRFDAERDARKARDEKGRALLKLQQVHDICEQSNRDRFQKYENCCSACASTMSLTRRELSPEGRSVKEMEIMNEVHPIELDRFGIRICTTCKGTHRAGEQEFACQNLTVRHQPTWRNITGDGNGVTALLGKILKH